MLWDSELKVGEAEGSYNEPGVLFGSITTSSTQGNPHTSARFQQILGKKVIACDPFILIFHLGHN